MIYCSLTFTSDKFYPRITRNLNSSTLPGKELYDTDGELVCIKPFPSMPIYFGNDPDGAKYRKAYFDKYDGECLFVNVFVCKFGVFKN